MYKRFLVVWFDPNKSRYYYRLLKHNYNDYHVGFVNQYDHICVLFDVIRFEYSKCLSLSTKEKLKRNMISFLEKI